MGATPRSYGLHELTSKPPIMGQFVGAIQGMAEACKALDYPVVSGNCSLYNETNGEPISPTPCIKGVSLLANVNNMATIAFKGEKPGHLCDRRTKGISASRSASAKSWQGRWRAARKPDGRYRHGKFIRNAIAAGEIKTCHDVSDGGLLVALAEMALAGDIGCQLDISAPDAAFWFGEDQGRYVVVVPDADNFQAVRAAGIPCCLSARRTRMR